MAMEPRSLAELKQVLSEVLRDTDESPRVRDDDRIVDDLGLDSIQMITFLLGVEERLDVELDFESLDLSKLGSVREFAQLVDGLLAAKGPA